jgi:8-oxo-dGTP pyrophosphatase MutT (NUDIX family)
VADWRSRLVWRVGSVIRPPVTLGVRCLVVDTTGAVLLVRHTYVPGWHLPGGAVDPGESTAEAAAREVAEETGVVLVVPPRLAGLFLNEALAARDHIAFFVARDHPAVDPASLRPRVGEIAAARMAAADRLPDDTTPATRRRIGEVLSGAPAGDRW